MDDLAGAPASLPRLKNPSGNQVMPRARLRETTRTTITVRIRAPPIANSIVIKLTLGSGSPGPPPAFSPEEDKIVLYTMVAFIFEGVKISWIQLCNLRLFCHFQFSLFLSFKSKTF